jgi:CheY-like chemotaxis protein
MNPSIETIVLAEDSSPNRRILTHLLEKMGFHVVACESGQVALDQLNSGKHDVKLVISDIMMPTMDGLELLRRIRESDVYKTLPVLLITAVSEKDYIERARALNVNGYILKPVTFTRVQEKLKAIFPDKVFPKIAV